MRVISNEHALSIRYWSRLTVTIVLVALSTSALAKDTSPVVQHYVADGEYESFRISPNGETLAYIDRQRGENSVVILNLTDMSLKAGFNSPDARVDQLDFLTDDHLIVNVTDYRRTIVGRDKFLFNINKNKKIKLNWGSHVSANSFSSGWMRDLFRADLSIYGIDKNSAKLAMGQFDKRQSTALYLADLETGKSSILERGTRQTRSWMVDRENNPLIRIDWDEDSNEIHFFVKKDKWQVLITLESMRNIRWSLSENQEKLHIIGGKLDPSSVLSVSLTDGSKETSIFTDMDRDASHFINNRNYQTLGVVYGGLKHNTRFIDAKINSAFERLNKSFPRSEVAYISGEDSLEKIIVIISGENGAFDYFLFNTSTLSLTKLKPAFPKIKHLAKRELLTYPSSDGTKIPAILRLPVTANTNAKIPLIVIPHGYGETSSVGFERKADFFSAKGYAVFSPNYRSTDGFGFELKNADMGLKNDLILQDIDDGIEFLSQHYSLDMTKIHAIGYGYGGYLALLSAANYPNRYKSIAVLDPITDLSDFPDRDFNRKALKEIFPQLEESDTALQDLSPINYAGQFAADVLLISDKKSNHHRQVKNMNKRLKSESKNVRLEVFKTKHGILDSKAHEKILNEIDDFLQM